MSLQQDHEVVVGVEQGSQAVVILLKLRNFEIIKTCRMITIIEMMLILDGELDAQGLIDKVVVKVQVHVKLNL